MLSLMTFGLYLDWCTSLRLIRLNLFSSCWSLRVVWPLILANKRSNYRVYQWQLFTLFWLLCPDCHGGGACLQLPLQAPSRERMCISLRGNRLQRHLYWKVSILHSSRRPSSFVNQHTISVFPCKVANHIFVVKLPNSVTLGGTWDWRPKARNCSYVIIKMYSTTGTNASENLMRRKCWSYSTNFSPFVILPWLESLCLDVWTDRGRGARMSEQFGNKMERDLGWQVVGLYSGFQTCYWVRQSS